MIWILHEMFQINLSSGIIQMTVLIYKEKTYAYLTLNIHKYNFLHILLSVYANVISSISCT